MAEEVKLPADPVEDEQQELVEELAATATIDELMETYIANVAQWFEDLTAMSEESNPVRTHIGITSLAEAVLTESYSLREKLIELLAKRGEDGFNRTGSNITKQVVDSTDEES
jgi:hypothetical protein